MGLDLSLTGTGIILIDKEGKIIIEKLVCTCNKEKIKGTSPIQYSPVLPEDRIIEISTKIDKICFEYKPDIIYTEGLSFGSKGRSVFELGGLHYTTKVRFRICGFEYKTIPPTVLKKFICNKGNAKKELMLLYTYKKYGIEFTDNNLCDAYCLARYAMEDYLNYEIKNI